MDGLARMGGGGGAFKLNGKTRYVGPLKLRHWAEIEQRILYLRPTNPLAEVGRVLHRIESADLAAHLLETTNADLRSDKNRRVIKMDEVVAWSNTEDGVAYTAWCCLRETACRDFDTLEVVTEALADLQVEELREFIRLRDQISGIDLFANADWPDPNAGVRPERRARRAEQSKKIFVPWRRVYYVLAHNCGFTAQSIGDLTLYQAKVYMSSAEEIGVSTGEGGGAGGSAGTIQTRRQTGG